MLKPAQGTSSRRAVTLLVSHPCNSLSAVLGWRGSSSLQLSQAATIAFVTFTYTSINHHHSSSPPSSSFIFFHRTDLSFRISLSVDQPLSHDLDVEMAPKGGAKGGKAAGGKSKPAEDDKKGASKVKGAQQIDVRHILVRLLLLSSSVTSRLHLDVKHSSMLLTLPPSARNTPKRKRHSPS